MAALFADGVRIPGSKRRGALSLLGTICRAFLEPLVLAGRISASTQAQALNALAFCFNHVAGTGLGDLGDFEKSRRARRIPVVFPNSGVRKRVGNGAVPGVSDGPMLVRAVSQPPVSHGK